MSRKIVHKALLNMVRAGDDHTGRQVALLFCVFDGPKTVRGLAEQMGVSKPVITRSVDRLETYDKFLVRKKDPSSGRSILVHITTTGRDWVNRMVS